jgi:hypothetical protein
MQKLISNLINLAVVSFSLVASATVWAQGTPLAVELLPLGKDLGVGAGQTVTPAYEGWYENEDGTLSLSFGYYNRNTREVLDISVGATNRIIGVPGGEFDQGQPTHFETGRHWGVFTVNVPGDYSGQVVWHLENQGKTFHVPANTNSDYIIDAISGDAMGNLPPEIRFQEGGTMGHGPAGITVGPLQAKTGERLSVEVWASDDNAGSGLAALIFGTRGGTPSLGLAWFKHQGPGIVEFSEANAKVSVDGGMASTDVTFSEAGDYLLRVRVTEPTGHERSGHAQCCWSNGFVNVTVSD